MVESDGVVRHQWSVCFSLVLALCSNRDEPDASSSADSPSTEWNLHFVFAASLDLLFVLISSSSAIHPAPSEKNSTRSALEWDLFLLHSLIRVFLLLLHFRSHTGFCPSLQLMMTVHGFHWPYEFYFAKTNRTIATNVRENHDTANENSKMIIWKNVVLVYLFLLTTGRCGAWRRIPVRKIRRFDVQQLLVLRFLLVVLIIILTGQWRQRTGRVIIVVFIVRGVQYG